MITYPEEEFDLTWGASLTDKQGIKRADGIQRGYARRQYQILSNGSILEQKNNILLFCFIKWNENTIYS